jgi:hypothetical protein
LRNRYINLVEKSEAAMISAIEIYNKPDFKYREETFALLALNAWELLLKAKVLADVGNDTKAIFVREKRPKRDGTLFKQGIRQEEPFGQRCNNIFGTSDRLA